jgi:hypothetical protein
MAISEALCWEVLRMIKGQSTLNKWFKGSDTDEPDFAHALPLFEIERRLVLRHKRSEIEDSLYFLQKRGYLIEHGFSGLTRVVLQLSPSALAVLEYGNFDAEEQQAFREALFDLKQPGWMGLKFNLGELWRRLRKARGT